MKRQLHRRAQSGLTRFQAGRGILAATVLGGFLGTSPSWGQAITPLQVPNFIRVDGNHAVEPSRPAAELDWIAGGNWGGNPISETAGIKLVYIDGVGTLSGLPTTGRWRGVRILDGVGNTDPDIFVRGGKENDTSTWVVEPGSVGSAKFDMTQAYLVSSLDPAGSLGKIFFGMERRDNSGSVAFDFEFNKTGPAGGLDSGGRPSWVPTRTPGDVLFTFEVTNGSSVLTVYYFIWEVTNGVGTWALKQSPPGLESRANDLGIPAPPWGFLDARGRWQTTGTMPAYSFAEASLDLSAIEFLSSGCGGSAFVQVRTRSSASDTSDLKDASRIFLYELPGPDAEASLAAGCSSNTGQGQFTYSSAGSKPAPGDSLSGYEWTFTVPAGVFLSGGGITGTPPTYTSLSDSGTVTVSGAIGTGGISIEASLVVTDSKGCKSAVTQPGATASTTVYPKPAAVPTLTAQCEQVFDFSSTVSGGSPSWTFTVPAGVTLTGPAVSGAPPTYTSTSASGTVTVGGLTGSATISAVLTVSNAGCSTTANAQVTIDPALTDKLSNLKVLDGANYTVGVSSAAPDNVGTTTYQWQRDIGSGWVNLPGATSQGLVYGFDGNEPAVVKDSNFSITLDGVTRPYAGRVFTVPVRVVVTRTLNGLTCVKPSESAILRKVIAVDP